MFNEQHQNEINLLQIIGTFSSHEAFLDPKVNFTIEQRAYC